jgi:superfamily II DNA/RNA helicase
MCACSCLTQIETLDAGVDVLVATPGRLLSHIERGSLNLSNTAALVLDEVDVLAGARGALCGCVERGFEQLACVAYIHPCTKVLSSMCVCVFQ